MIIDIICGVVADGAELVHQANNTTIMTRRIVKKLLENIL